MKRQHPIHQRQALALRAHVRAPARALNTTRKQHGPRSRAEVDALRSHKHALRTGPTESDLPKQEHGAASITRRAVLLLRLGADGRLCSVAALRSGGGRALLASLRSDCNKCLRRPPLLSFAPACWHRLLRSGSPGRAEGRIDAAMWCGRSVGSRPAVDCTERPSDTPRQSRRRGRVARLRASPALAPWRQVRYAPCHHLSPTRFESARARERTRPGRSMGPTIASNPAPGASGWAAGLGALKKAASEPRRSSRGRSCQGRAQH